MGLVGPTLSIDGGYHAIRGFAFQFDATILEAWADPEACIGIEGDQDIDIDNFYIQVKLRSQPFAPSQIAKAVKQILAQFSRDTSRRYRLYCHFRDQVAGTILRFDDAKLDKVLGADTAAHTDEVKKLFIDRFEVKFAPDFQAQFLLVLKELKLRYSLRTDEQAIAYHAVLNQHLTTLVLTEAQGLRMTSARQLDAVVRTAERAVFQGCYQNYLGRGKYLALLRSSLPGSRSVNVVRRQRLVVVEVEPKCDLHDIVDLAAAARSRFYVPKNSPQPFLLIRGCSDIVGLKRALWDAGIMFTDGTHFDGDRFRVEDLIGPIHPGIGLRVVDETKLTDLMESIIRIQEVYEFYSTRPIVEGFKGIRLRRMAVDSLLDAVKVMEVGHRA